MPHIGDLTLDRIHNDTLAEYRKARRADGATAGTINKELSWEEQDRLFKELPGHLQLDGRLHGKHGLPGTGSVPAPMGLGSETPGTNRCVEHDRPTSS